MLMNLQGGHYLVWAHSVPRATQQFLGSYRRMVENNRTDLSFTIIQPFQAPPSCDCQEDIFNLSAGPLAGNKWNDIIMEKQILLQPAEYTVSGNQGPKTLSRSMLIAELRPNVQNPPVTNIIKWREFLTEINTGAAIILISPAAICLEYKR